MPYFTTYEELQQHLKKHYQHTDYTLIDSQEIIVLTYIDDTKEQIHLQNYYEMNYVAHGACHFVSNHAKILLQEGELCFMTPFRGHNIFFDSKCELYSILIKKTTFEKTFFSVLSGNLLCDYFRTSLQKDFLGYILFYLSDRQKSMHLIHLLQEECKRNDRYSIHYCTNWLNLFLLSLLRNYNETIQFYQYQMGTDFSLMLQYIQHNYQSLTLSSLAEIFAYSEPHLSTLIRQNTGHTYTDLIKKLRLSKAIAYLTNSDLKIGDIAVLVGYNSADHFSRVFRSEYNLSPQQYRKYHTNPFVFPTFDQPNETD